jgi:hypothetical protein
MNLTKYDKAAFVRAVMGDVPRVDYDAELAALVAAWDVADMPEKVRELYQDEKLRRYVARDFRLRTPFNLCDVCTVVDLNPLEGARKEAFEAMIAKSQEQRDQRTAARHQLESLIAPFRTLAAAKKGLPEELHKYLPADRSATGVANLPAVSSPVDLLKAMGWPK